MAYKYTKHIYNIGMILANFQIDGVSRVSQMSLMSLECRFQEMFEKLVVGTIMATYSIMCLIQRLSQFINNREYRRGNQKRKNQQNLQHRTHNTRKTKRKYNTICIGYLYIAQQISETIVHIVVQAPKWTWRLLLCLCFLVIAVSKSFKTY